MVGIVIVSHSGSLADSIVNLTRMMASDANIAPAGGMEDGSFGTSYEKIKAAILQVSSGDGVVILMDMGSAVMTTEMVLEELCDDTIKMVDCPVTEGAIAATVSAVNNVSLSEIIQELENIKHTPKF